MREPKIEVKNVKIADFASEETLCFEATVYVNGVRAFKAENDGRGGCNFYHPVSQQGKSLLKLCNDWLETLPEEEHMFGEEVFSLQPDLDIFLGDMIADWELNKKLKRDCRTKTLYRMPEDAKGEFYVFKVPYGAKIKAHIMAKYPTAEIINERFL